MPESPLRKAITPAPLLLAAALLTSGCGGARSAEMAPPPNGGSVTASAASDGFMRVGQVDLEGETPAGAASDVPPPPPPPPPNLVPKDPETKASDSGKKPNDEWSQELSARAAASASPAAEGSHSRNEKDKVHGAVVDSTGGLSEAEIRETLSKQQGVFRACYDLGVASAAGAFSGTVNLRAAIGPTGTVVSADVTSSSTKNIRVDTCVVDAVRKLQFPAKGGGAVVGIPIEFGR